ncbi:MAG TPA: alkaline phosphatase family protein, partial [Actinomycetota bacterium]|nr:alkaline phosphatase family protein [Actinomycetota bacterium]
LRPGARFGVRHGRRQTAAHSHGDDHADRHTFSLAVAPRLIVLGWDSATFDVADLLLADGRLPALGALAEKGFRAPLRSTWPPMTDCAWTSAFTGVNPGKHGIFGSWYRAPGSYSCRYFSGRDRKAAALWEIADEPRFLVWNVPMTYPPERVHGAMLAGYGAPPGAVVSEPRDLQTSLAQRWPLVDLLDRAPHGSLEEFRDDLLRGLAAQAQALPWAIREIDADVVLAVWPHVDRAQHFFWNFRGTRHPLAPVVDDVYEAMDRATGAVVDAFPDADVLIVSDHGAGTLNGDINVGAFLAQHGHAEFARPRRSPASLVWSLPPSVRRLGRRVAPGLARKAMSARLAGQLAPFDWNRTEAFFGFHSDLWLNLAGREPDGIVSPDRATAVVNEIRAELLSIEDPATGLPVFAGAHTRDEIYSGEHAALGPDLMLDPWSAGYRVAPSRRAGDELVIPPEPLAGVEAPWSSDHRPLGIFVAGGPRVARGSADELNLYDVTPTALALLGASIPEGLDGRAVVEAIDPGHVEAHPISAGGAVARRDGEGGVYSDAEAAAVAEHLKELGYIE